MEKKNSTEREDRRTLEPAASSFETKDRGTTVQGKGKAYDMTNEKRMASRTV